MKEKKWNTTKLIAAGSFGILSLVLQLPGVTIPAITGIPMSSVINMFIAPVFIVMCLFVIDKFGAATIMLSVFGILALPLPLAGTPGFFPKVLIFIIGGLFADLIYYFFKKNKVFVSVLIGILIPIYLGLGVYFVGNILGMPGLKQAAKFSFSPPMILISLLLVSGGGYLGYLIYNKIKNTSIVKRIQR